MENQSMPNEPITRVDRTGKVQRIWSPETFIRMCNESGYTDDDRLADDASVGIKDIRTLQKADKTITMRIANQVAPKIGMDPIAFLTCHNALVVGDQLTGGFISPREAYSDHANITEQYQPAKALDQWDLDITSGTLTYLEDALQQFTQFLLDHANEWPGAKKAEWLRSSTFSPQVATTRSG